MDSVRSIDDPSGNCVLAKMIPRSSLGTKPVDICWEVNQIPSAANTMTNGVIHLCLKIKCNDRPYRETIREKPVLNPFLNLWNTFLSASDSSFTGFRKRAHKAGLSVSALTAE